MNQILAPLAIKFGHKRQKLINCYSSIYIYIYVLTIQSKIEKASPRLLDLAIVWKRITVGWEEDQHKSVEEISCQSQQGCLHIGVRVGVCEGMD